MKRLAILAVLLAGCAESIPQAADRAASVAVRKVADDYEAGQVDEQVLPDRLSDAQRTARTKVLVERFDPAFRAASKPERVELLRRYADDLEPVSPWTAAPFVVGAALCGVCIGWEARSRRGN